MCIIFLLINFHFCETHLQEIGGDQSRIRILNLQLGCSSSVFINDTEPSNILSQQGRCALIITFLNDPLIAWDEEDYLDVIWI